MSCEVKGSDFGDFPHILLQQLLECVRMQAS